MKYMYKELAQSKTKSNKITENAKTITELLYVDCFEEFHNFHFNVNGNSNILAFTFSIILLFNSEEAKTHLC